MLAQGQSSSAKRGGLVADVSSVLIFLKKKKTRICHTELLNSCPELLLKFATSHSVKQTNTMTRKEKALVCVCIYTYTYINSFWSLV